jgi:hypothetical protein
VTLGLIDGNAHFVNLWHNTLEVLLPALVTPLPLPLVGNPAGTTLLAAALEAVTCPAAQKIVTVEDKWPYSYGPLLLSTGAENVGELHGFWYDYANQKKVHCRWAYVQSPTASMTNNLLGLKSSTIVAKTIKVLDYLVLAGASQDSLSEGLAIWQFPSLGPADTGTDSVNKSLRLWEGLLTRNMVMSLLDVKEILQVGKVGALKSWLHTCAQLEHWAVIMATLLGAGHKAVAWLLSLAQLACAKALVFDRQASNDPQLPLAMLA